MLEQTKAERILALYNAGLTTKEIGKVVDCHPSYVRVVARQRKGGGRSENDKRYTQSSLGRSTRKAWVQGALPRMRAYNAAVEATGDKDKANRESRKAYAKARAGGASVLEAHRAGKNVRKKVLNATCDKRATRAAYASGKSIF